MIRRFLISLDILLLTLLCATAQDRYASGFGLSESDASAIERVNQRMDSIRYYRPTVALVLSGGGAKGAAHLGTLKAIEKLDLPIDIIIGTSMGGLVGGLYSLGYNSAELETFVRSIDWDYALSDKVTREFMPYKRFIYNSKYIASFDFHLGRKNHVKYISQSLPSGLVEGQNVSHLLAQRTVNYSDSLDFLTLPIPFMCVATDLVSGRAKVWHSGEINTALRSTMSIPGLFTPVKGDGMILVDGGMRNNFPVDLAREVGADIVIGVELSDADAEYEDINNLLDIAMKSIDMMGNDAFRRNIQSVDLKIKPNLDGYNMLSFDTASIDSIIRRGNEAAERNMEELKMMKYWIGGDSLSRAGKSAVDITRQKVQIKDIKVSGLSKKEAEYVRSHIDISPGDECSANEIEEAISNVFGERSFTYVGYELLGDDWPYILHVKCKKRGPNRIGGSMRCDTEELISVLLNAGFRTNNMSGFSIDGTAKIGANPYATARFRYISPELRNAFNFSSHLRWVDRNFFQYGEDKFNIAYIQAKQEFYMEPINTSYSNARIGLRHDYYKIGDVLSNGSGYAYDPESMGFNGYVSVFGEYNYDSRDNYYFPTQGIELKASLTSLHSTKLEDQSAAVIFSLNAKKVFPLKHNFSLIPAVYIRSIASPQLVPLPYVNAIGGHLAGRYIDQQIPFVGINGAMIRNVGLTVLRGDLRYQISPNQFISAIANVAYDVNFENSSFNGLFGAGVEYACRIMGIPLRANLSYSPQQGVSLYSSIGFDF